jgi:hypothetical protein
VVHSKVMATALGRRLSSRSQRSLGLLNRPFRHRASPCVLGMIDFSTHVSESSNRKKSSDKENFFAYPSEIFRSPTTSGQSPLQLAIIVTHFNASLDGSSMIMEDDGG